MTAPALQKCGAFFYLCAIFTDIDTDSKDEIAKAEDLLTFSDKK